jgi:hypothetical protein
MISNDWNENFRERASRRYKITWLNPTLAWAMDDYQIPSVITEGKL